MRAVNLIPDEDRRGAGGAAGRSGGAAYVLLGALAVAVAMASLYALAGKSVTDKRAELARINQAASAAMARANALQPYTKFAALREKRVQTVTQIAQGRFDWAHAMHEIARVLPTDAWLTQVTGTTSPASTMSGGSGLRSSLPVPAVEILGCTTSQGQVAQMISRMRLIDGVQHVSLSDSSKTDSAVNLAGAGGGTGNDCRTHVQFPQFDIVVFFNPTTPATAAGTDGPHAVAAAVTTAAPASTVSTPAPASPAAGAPATSSPASGGSTP